MRIVVSAELHGKQHKVEVQLMGKGDLVSVKDEIERALQTQIFLREKNGGLGIRIEELQFYDVRNYCWVPLTAVEMIEDRCQLYAVVRERDGSMSPARSVRSVRERTLPPSPLTKLPQPKDLALPRGASPSPSRISVPLRATTTTRSVSPSHLPRYVPPAVNIPDRTPRTPTRREDVSTAWQTEFAKKAFRGYLVGPDGAVITSAATPRTNSPSPFMRLTKEEFSSIFPPGAVVLMKGTSGKEEKAQVVGHTTSGNVEVQLPNGTVLQMHPSMLRISESEGFCVLQGKPHDCDLSPGRASRRSMDDWLSTDLKGEGFLRDSLEAQTKVFNHTIAKHQSILVEERGRREVAEKKLAHIKGGVVMRLVSSWSMMVMKRYFVAWRGWCGDGHWGEQQPAPRQPPTPPVADTCEPVDTHLTDDVNEVLSGLQVEVEKEGGRFEAEWGQRVATLKERVEGLKAKLDEQAATIKQQAHLIGAYRHDLKIPHDPVDEVKCSQCGGPPTPAEPDLEAVPPPVSPSIMDPETPTSPLANEVTTLHSQIAKLRRKNEMLIEEMENKDPVRLEHNEQLQRQSQVVVEKSARVDALEDQVRVEQITSKMAADDLRASQERVKELESIIRTKNLDVSTSMPLPWDTEKDENPVYAAAKKTHKMAVERAVSSTKRTSSARGRVMSQGTPKKRTGSIKSDHHVPVQARNYLVGTEVVASNLNGTTFKGRVIGHTHGRVEVETVSGVTQTILPSRIRSAEAPAQSPSTPRGRTPGPPTPPEMEEIQRQSPRFPTPPSPKRDEGREEHFVHTSTPGKTPGEDEVVLIEIKEPPQPEAFKLDSNKRVTPKRKSKR